MIAVKMKARMQEIKESNDAISTKKEQALKNEEDLTRMKEEVEQMAQAREQVEKEHAEQIRHHSSKLMAFYSIGNYRKAKN